MDQVHRFLGRGGSGVLLASHSVRHRNLARLPENSLSYENLSVSDIDFPAETFYNGVGIKL
jgi:hypothetical protein